jgi:hypothetical protein
VAKAHTGFERLCGTDESVPFQNIATQIFQQAVNPCPSKHRHPPNFQQAVKSFPFKTLTNICVAHTTSGSFGLFPA